MATHRTETTSLDLLAEHARAIARTLEPGVIVGIRGPLGAGMTTFAKLLGEALGVREVIISPTFVYEQVYPVSDYSRGIHWYVHLDLYRLQGPEDLAALGLEIGRSEAVTVVEWIDRVPEIAARAGRLLDFSLDPDGRRFLVDRRPGS